MFLACTQQRKHAPAEQSLESVMKIINTTQKLSETFVLLKIF